MAVYNKSLAKLRAEAVANYAKKHGFETEIRYSNQGPYTRIYVKYKK